MSGPQNGHVPLDDDIAKHAPVAGEDFVLDLINGRVVFRGRRPLMIREDTMAVPIGFLVLMHVQLMTIACRNDPLGAVVRKALQDTPPHKAVATPS